MKKKFKIIENYVEYTLFQGEQKNQNDVNLMSY